MQALELTEIRVSRHLTFMAATHAMLVIGSLVLATLWQIPSALVLGAPSLVILVAAALEPRLQKPEVAAWVDRPRALEGDSVVVTVGLTSARHVPVVDLEFEPHKNLDYEGSLRALRSLDANTESLFDFDLVVDAWGVIELGNFRLRVRDRFGLTSLSASFRITTTIRIHIHEEPARSLSEPDRFRRLVGSHLSEERSEGCEIADIRPYQPGDRLQQLNWRISARNDEPWITLRHPDRSTTIVLMLDAYQSFGHNRADALRRSIRATLGLARLHLGAQDPVGLLIIGQQVRWFPPELGPRQLHTMTDAMLELSTMSWGERRQGRLSAERLIPKDAIVLAVSPLADGRFVNTLTSLRAKGHSVQVVEPVTHWPHHTGIPSKHGWLPPVMSWRIYSLQQQVERNRLINKGIPVVPWDEDQPIESVLLSLRMRQRARRAGVLQ